MIRNNKHINDHDLTLEQYLQKYLGMLDKSYHNTEVKDYLTKRWEFINNKAEYKEVSKAFAKTNFPKAIAARNENTLQNAQVHAGVC